MRILITDDRSAGTAIVGVGGVNCRYPFDQCLNATVFVPAKQIIPSTNTLNGTVFYIKPITYDGWIQYIDETFVVLPESHKKKKTPKRYLH